jgi:hypothetical protein
MQWNVAGYRTTNSYLILNREDADKTMSGGIINKAI